MFVSIIIPSYNSEKTLRRTIDSCLAQTDFIKEIIIVDDFSTDSSFTIAQTYTVEYPGKVKVYKNNAKGGNNARNYGYQKSTGEFIQWLDADDTLLPDKLRIQLDFFNNNTDVDITYCDWEIATYNEREQILRCEDKKSMHFDDYLYELLADNWIAPHAYLLRKGIAQKLNDMKAWNPSTKIAQDREYFTLAAIIGAKFGYAFVNGAVYNRYLGKKSLSRSVNMKTKSAQIIKLLIFFLRQIKDQSWMVESKKKRYEKIIYTQVAYYSVAFQNPFPFSDLKFSQIKWKMIHGYRTRLKILYYLLVGKFSLPLSVVL